LVPLYGSSWVFKFQLVDEMDLTIVLYGIDNLDFGFSCADIFKIFLKLDFAQVVYFNLRKIR
jgi:hypothetical protein